MKYIVKADYRDYMFTDDESAKALVFAKLAETHKVSDFEVRIVLVNEDTEGEYDGEDDDE